MYALFFLEFANINPLKALQILESLVAVVSYYQELRKSYWKSRTISRRFAIRKLCAFDSTKSRPIYLPISISKLFDFIGSGFNDLISLFNSLITNFCCSNSFFNCVYCCCVASPLFISSLRSFL